MAVSVASMKCLRYQILIMANGVGLKVFPGLFDCLLVAPLQIEIDAVVVSTASLKPIDLHILYGVMRGFFVT